jgi:hypothetical protein
MGNDLVISFCHTFVIFFHIKPTLKVKYTIYICHVYKKSGDNNFSQLNQSNPTRPNKIQQNPTKPNPMTTFKESFQNLA